ncbi:MAG TPA: alpha/beta fold hydrolase [Croceibacterium sp.]|nr:alpha/beta fold hydrolase [Croceibacterium sp.]
MLLFLPGLICDARIYAPQLAAFPASRAVDGYGMAGSLEAMARVALAQADREGAERFDLFGHSMGGRVALEVYRLAPRRVRRLALSSTGIHPVAEQEPAKRAALKAIGHDHGFAALVDVWLPPMVAEANRARPIYREMREMSLDQGQALFDTQIGALLGRPDVRGLLPEIACPTLVITGELDEWSPPAQHREIAAAIPDASLVIVPGAGHMLPLEAPAAVNAAIADWLARPADEHLLPTQPPYERQPS